MGQWSNSLPIVQETASAIRNYVRKSDLVRNMKIESVDILISIARDAKYDKIKPVIGQALKMMSKVSEFDSRIRMKNGNDLL